MTFLQGHNYYNQVIWGNFRSLYILMLSKNIAQQNGEVGIPWKRYKYQSEILEKYSKYPLREAPWTPS